MKLRIALLSTLFLFLAGAALATPTGGETPAPGGTGILAAWDLDSAPVPTGYALPPTAAPLTAQYYPWPCDAFPTPPSPNPFPIPWPFPSPWPGPTDQCIPNPFPF